MKIENIKKAENLVSDLKTLNGMTAAEMHKEFSIMIKNIEKKCPGLIYHITYEDGVKIITCWIKNKFIF